MAITNALSRRQLLDTRRPARQLDSRVAPFSLNLALSDSHCVAFGKCVAGLEVVRCDDLQLSP